MRFPCISLPSTGMPLGSSALLKAQVSGPYGPLAVPPPKMTSHSRHVAGGHLRRGHGGEGSVVRVVSSVGSIEVRSRQVFTERDKIVLCWLGQQHGCSLDVLRAKLGKTNPDVGRAVSRWAARNQVRRWQEQGLVRVEHLLGSTWVTLSPKGLSKLGLDYPNWAMPVTKLAHTHAVSVVRLWHETTRPGSAETWVCERDLLAERSRHGNWHIGDAALVGDVQAGGTGTSPHWLIEVELHPKARTRYVTEVFERLRPTVTGLIYFVPPALLDRVQSDVAAAQQQARLGKAVRLSFRPLPTLDDVMNAMEGGDSNAQ